MGGRGKEAGRRRACMFSISLQSGKWPHQRKFNFVGSRNSTHHYSSGVRGNLSDSGRKGQFDTFFFLSCARNSFHCLSPRGILQGGGSGTAHLHVPGEDLLVLPSHGRRHRRGSFIVLVVGAGGAGRIAGGATSPWSGEGREDRCLRFFDGPIGGGECREWISQSSS
jgi:hypothetical protein